MISHKLLVREIEDFLSDRDRNDPVTQIARSPEKLNSTEMSIAHAEAIGK